MDAFFQGLANIVEPQVSMALVIGAIGGLVIGAIPGIGPAIAVASLVGEWGVFLLWRMWDDEWRFPVIGMDGVAAIITELGG